MSVFSTKSREIDAKIRYILNCQHAPTKGLKVREKIVYQEVDPCPYLEGEDSKTPLRYQFQPLSGPQTDFSFQNGDRRVGRMLYDTQCPSCSACEAIRIQVNEFSPSKSQRRILRKNEDIRVEMSRSFCTPEKLEMYNKHKNLRGLNKRETAMTASGYENWFSRSCLDTREFHYSIGDRLVGVSVLDFGEKDISSVYFFFDPDFSARSLGTFSALFEIMWMKSQQRRFYYLGLYVQECSHLNYKARFYPHQRRVQGHWRAFSSAKTSRAEARLL